MAARKAMFEALIQVFEEAGLPYCVLAGYDEYPEVIPSDIDFMVPEDWRPRLRTIVLTAAVRSGGHLVQRIAHESTADYYAIARLDGDRITWLHPDSCSDFRRGGNLLLAGEGVMQRRRRHRRGFWVPAPADAFAYYLTKKLDKGGIDAAQAAQLSARHAEDPAGCARALADILPPDDAAAVAAAAGTQQWAPVFARLPALTAAMERHARRETRTARLRQLGADARRVLDRLLRPTGLCVAFLGPDGSGKSSVIARVSVEMAQAFRRVDYRHLRPPLWPLPSGGAPAGDVAAVVVDDPHARPARSAAGSLAKLLYFWAAYVVGGVAWLYPRRVTSRLVVFDRYYHDILADPRRYRFLATPGLMRMARELGRRLPMPDLVFILDAAPELLQARKQEVPLAETARQRDAYLALAGELENAHIIDAGKPLDQVVASVLGHILAAMEARTHHRLGLDRSTDDKRTAAWRA